MIKRKIPKIYWKDNVVADHLEDIRSRARQLFRKGTIYGLVCVDQDSKTIAVNHSIDTSINYYDLGNIGAQLFGVARQAMDLFDTKALKAGFLVFEDMQLVIRSVGKVNLSKKGLREVLVILMADVKFSIGMLLLQLNSAAAKIRKAIEENDKIKRDLSLGEQEFKKRLIDILNTDRKAKAQG